MSSIPTMPSPGQKIRHYLLTDLLKQRAVSSLYLAQDTRADQSVFIEILHATADEDAVLVGQFQRRMETVLHLKHAHIASILTIGQTAEKRPFAVIQYAAGTFLSEKLTTWHQTDTLSALTLIRLLADALTAAHPVGIFHHDLRPHNIYIQTDDTPFLLDLGVNITPLNIDETYLEETGMLDYASIEQLRGQALTGRSNIFSLGIILYELLSGQRPQLPVSDWDIFDRRVLPKEIPLEEVCPGLTSETYELVKNCLWPQEWNRYDTIQEMLVAVDKAIAAENDAPARSQQFVNNTWRLYGLIAGGMLLIILVIVIIILLQ